MRQRSPASLVILSDLLPRSDGSGGTVGVNGIVDDPTTAALEGLASLESGVWIGRMRGGAPSGGPRYRPLAIDPDDVADFDEGQSRTTIWPVYHDMARPAQFDQKWRRAYYAVNRAYALAAAQNAAGGAAVWVHDYKLQLVPGILRRLRPDLRIGLHLQTPFPAPDLFRHMPMHRDILIGLLGADLLGFETESAAENFLRLTHDVTDFPPSVGVYPTSVDTPAIVDTLSHAGIDSAAAALRSQLGNPRTVILNVSTADQADSIERAVLGLAKLFRTQRLSPDDVAMVQVLLGGDGADPSAVDRIGRATAHVNGQFAVVGRPCVHYVVADLDLVERTTLYRAADILLATPICEGTTMAAVEFVAAARPDAALVLSEFSGSASVLTDAYLVNPNDDDQVYAGVLAALAADSDERAKRMHAMRDYVISYHSRGWATRFLEHLRALDLRASANSVQSGGRRRRPIRARRRDWHERGTWLTKHTGGSA